MNRQHIHLRGAGCRVLAGLATLVGALLALAAPAYASRPPGYGDPVGTHTTVRVITGGMPGWQVTLIAIAAAVFAAALAVALDRVRRERRQVRATTA